MASTRPREGSPPGGFDLDHIGAEVSEQLAGVGPQLEGEIEDADVVEG